MNITQRLMQDDPSLVLHNEGHWTEQFDPKLFGFSSFNDAGLETETGEFLYTICRLLKPKRVLETGTHVGVGASYIGSALKDNLLGVLDTVEFIPELHLRATERLRRLGLLANEGTGGPVYTYLDDVAKWKVPEDWTGSNSTIQSTIGGPQPQFTYQMILLDTEPQTRFAEMEKFWKYLDDGGYLFIHDLHNHMHQIENEEHGFAWPYGPLTDFIKELVRTGQARPFHFPTPRGLTGFYKVSPSDYKWEGKNV